MIRVMGRERAVGALVVGLSVLICLSAAARAGAAEARPFSRLGPLAPSATHVARFAWFDEALTRRVARDEPLVATAGTGSVATLFGAAFRRVVDETAAERSGPRRVGGAHWEVELRETASRRVLFSARVEGDELPDPRSLYVLVVSLSHEASGTPFEYRVAIGPDSYREYRMDEEKFISLWVGRATRALARSLGYTPDLYGANFFKMVRVSSWRYELFRFNETTPKHRGGKPSAGRRSGAAGVRASGYRG